LPVFKNRMDLMMRHEELSAESPETMSHGCTGPVFPVAGRVFEKLAVLAVERSYSVPS
jgi:hypothetical protein